MNIKNVLLLVATFLVPAVSSAVCPTEKSTVFYINGVGVRQPEADSSRKRLDDVLIADPRVAPDCVVVKTAYSYSANETIPYAGIALDLVESLIQKAAETGRSVTDATRSLLRLDDATWIDDILQTTAVLASGATYLIDDQITEHLAAYQTEAQTSGTLILAGHSQGNYFANEEWGMLSAAAKLRVHLVAVATPATSQADGGPYVTVDRDFWAAAIFAPFGAPSFNVQNVEPCVGDILDWWFCHGWKESYMNGTNSRNLIVADIIALLPTTTPIPPGRARVQGRITFADTGEPASRAYVFTEDVITRTDDSGLYTIFPQACTECFLSASANEIHACAFEANLTFDAGQTYTKDMVLRPEDCPMPQ